MTPVEQPVIAVRGEKVALGPLDLSMAPHLAQWLNEFTTFRTLGADPRPTTAAQQSAWIQRVSTLQDDVVFAIHDLDGLAFVGSTNLFNIDRRHGTCEVAIAILDPDRRGKGLGTDAMRLITNYAIRDLGMHNVHLATLAFNVAGIRAYRKAGFREYGRRREAWLHNGRRWDMVHMEVLASEWLGGNP